MPVTYKRLYTDHSESVATTWLISFRRVAEQSAVASDLLKLLAYLAYASSIQRWHLQGQEAAHLLEVTAKTLYTHGWSVQARSLYIRAYEAAIDLLGFCTFCMILPYWLSSNKMMYRQNSIFVNCWPLRRLQEVLNHLSMYWCLMPTRIFYRPVDPQKKRGSIKSRLQTCSIGCQPGDQDIRGSSR